MKKLKQRWQITSNVQLILILVVFAITGSVAAYLSKPITNSIGLTKEAVSLWVYWPVRILILFPIYQIMLVFVGTIAGQFKFFWAFEKKMLYRIKLGFIADFVDKKLNN